MAAPELAAAAAQRSEGKETSLMADSTLKDRVAAAGRFALGLARRAQFLAPLLTRVILGVAFFYTGKGKLAHLDGTTAFFEHLGIPAPGFHAVFVGGLELVGGIALALGVATRLFSAGLLGTMAVALLTAHRQEAVDALKEVDFGTLIGIAPVPFAIGLLWLVFYGPGLASLDRIVAGYMGWTEDRFKTLDSGS
ncbi:MAG: DoxX family protein [Planctomycetota bacterium]|nr:DoxX family protein [Planctomycetota bacterium]